MVKSIVSDNARPIKDGYQTAHESLCAKLQQARAIANVMTGSLSKSDIYHLGWCLSDLLEAAAGQCEVLKVGETPAETK